jgi:hypothetical protein
MGKSGVGSDDGYVRVRKVLEEHWGLKSICEDCGRVLKKVDLPVAGVGDNATMPYYTCEVCDQYFILWDHDDEG